MFTAFYNLSYLCDCFHCIFQSQFFAVVIHTGINMTQADCDFPQGFNYAVFLYAISLIVLFSNFFQKAYRKKER